MSNYEIHFWTSRLPITAAAGNIELISFGFKTKIR